MSQQEVQQAENPFQVSAGPSIVQPLSGLVSVEQQRAVAEIQGRMMMARMNPRDPRRCMDLILNDCQRVGLAEDAAYAYARGGSDVSGPSIRLAEAVARRWGNIASGIKELARGNGYSDVVAYAWDLETGYYDERLFQVKHWRDTKKGGYQLEDERDIYELIANMGQRRKRAVLLTVIPGDVVEAALRQCELTLKAKADTSPETIAKMVAAFAEFGVSKDQIETRIQRRIDAIQPAQVISLKRIYASLRDSMSEAKDWFEPVTAAQPDTPPASARERLRTAALGDDRQDQAARTVPADVAPQTAHPAPAEAATEQAAPAQRRAPRGRSVADEPAHAAHEAPADPPPAPGPSLLERFAVVLDRAENSADVETAYVLLDEARGLMAEMNDANRKAAEASLAEAMAKIKAGQE